MDEDFVYDRIVNLSPENVEKAKTVLNDYAVAVQNNTLGDYSQSGALYHILDALNCQFTNYN